MLISLLKEIEEKETNSLSSLAKTFGFSEDMIVQMLTDLKRMGYLVFDDTSCADDTCTECGVCCTKKNNRDKGTAEVGSGQWKLTDKGRGIIS